MASPPALPPRKTLYESSPHIPPPPPAPVQDDPPDALSLWAYSTSSVLASLALPLLAFPRFIAVLVGGFGDGRPGGGSPHNGWGGRNADLSGLERFLCCQLGVLLLGFAVVVLVLASPAPSYAETETIDKVSHDRYRLVGLTTPLLLASAFLAYWSTLGSLASLLSVCMGGLGLFGAWVLLFNEDSHLSKSTHADKRTSNFPFANKTSARSIKDSLRWRPTRPADTVVGGVKERKTTRGDPLGAQEEIELKTR